MAVAAALRVVALPLPGTSDVELFRDWAYHAAAGNVTEIYGVGGWPPVRNLDANVDYPPVAVYHLAVAGRLHQILFPDPSDRTGLTIVIKSLIMVGNGLLTVLIWWFVKRRDGVERARVAAALYWANPAVILGGAVLGYIGVIAFLPAVGALVCAVAGRARLSGALLAIACLTKPQGVFVAPAVLLALAPNRTLTGRRLTAALVSAAATGGVIVAPFLLTGSFGNMSRAVGALVTDGLVSGNAANLWWIVSFLVQAGHRLDPTGLAQSPDLVRIFSLAELFAFGPAVAQRSAGTLAITAVSWMPVLAVVAWAARRIRDTDDAGAFFALTALTVHAYFVLAVQVHENHMSFALPALAVVAAERVAYRRLLLVLSAVVALNLNLFAGFGSDIGFALPRSITSIDATVVLAIVNVAALVGHVRLFARQWEPARRPAVSRPSGASTRRAIT